jgi:protein arginine N-methyltransferase 1
VEKSNVIEYAKKIIRANRYDKGNWTKFSKKNFSRKYFLVIKVIKGKIEDIELPEGIQQVDIIIAEWMGYTLFYDSIIQSVLYARDKFLVNSLKKSKLEFHRFILETWWADFSWSSDDVYGWNWRSRL